MLNSLVRWAVAAATIAATFGGTPEALAQQAGPTVIPVPFSQINPALPHPAYENARITLKAIARSAPCAAGYRVVWDANLNGNYDDDAFRDVTPIAGSNTLYDLGVTFTVPPVAQDTRMPVGVRVRSKCANEADAFGTFRLFVYDFEPNPDPTTWTADQVNIIGQVTVQESLWWAHRQLANRANFNTNTVRAQYGTYSYVINGPGVWMFTTLGHQPAYPPNTINAFGGALPNGFAAANNARWATDPYAETVVAIVNGALNAGTAAVAIPNAADEDNTCGFNANGTERFCNRVPGTLAAQGAYTGNNSNNTYAQGMLLGGLATVLPTLAGTPLQVGGLAGRSWESFIQDMTDYLGYQQYDGGCALGGWLYTAANGAGACTASDGSTSQWAYIGLESAEVNGAPFGVFVNNRHKYRIAANLVNNQAGTGGAAYRSTYSDNFQLTGGAFVASRWLGIHAFARGDVTPAFPGYAINYSNNAVYTRDRLRQAYDNYITFTGNNWTNNTRYSTSVGWHDRLWENGDYLCGNRAAVYNAGRCGNTYGMYSHQKGYRTGAPELASIGGHDWFREFTIYYARAQDRTIADYTNFGRITDAFCAGHTQVTCNYGSPWMSSSFGSLTTTNTLFRPKPVAQPVAQPTTVVEGCIGGNNGLVTFSHADSFHPNPSSRILAYQWDFDASNGLWWDTGAAPDWQTPNVGDVFAYRYARAGNYTATLRVVDNSDPQLTDARTVTITVNAAANVGPSAAAGGPYIIEVGQALQLAGSANDQNVACGDVLTVGWDVNGAGTFAFAGTPTSLVPFANMANLPIGQPIPLRIRVRDAAGLEATANTTLTIYPTDPVAVAQVIPNPAACGQAVTFDAGRSYHPNPLRVISTYQWNVDGQPGFDGGGADPRFTYTYNRFGAYNVVLRVTDDLGRRNETQIVMRVDQGNTPPVARTSTGEYLVLEGDALPLDGRPSSDANVNCGDSIVTYEWDLNNNGRFNDAGIDVQGSNPVIPWNTVRNLFRWPADRATGLPNNTVTLRVTDTFGQQSTVNAVVTIYRALPEAVVVQTPRPAPISLRDGTSTVTLDGRESTSPIPGMTIARYDWDLDDNGVFERQNVPFLDYARIFNPIPSPANIPAVFVSLRVTDRDGRTATTRYQIQYRVPPTPPTADADPTDPPEQDYHILLGDGVTLDASQSFDPDTAEFQDFIQHYRWDVNANLNRPVWDRDLLDGNGDGREARLPLTAVELAAMGVGAPGTFNVLLEVEDTTLLTNRDTATLNVYARDPVAAATANPNPAACGARVTLDASRSDHPHPAINVVSWAWDTDADGQYDDEMGEVVVHTFNQFSFAGPFQVGLQVTDSNGNRGTTVVPVNVNQGNRAPVANPGGPYVIALNDNLALDGRGSVEPDAACGDAIVRYDWDLNADGTIEFSGAANAQQAATWAQLGAAGINHVGNYVVQLTVRDRFGVAAQNVAQLRVVNGPSALAQAIPNNVGCNDAVTFDASGSSTDGPVNAGFALVRYEWDFGADGTYDAEGIRVVHNMVGRGPITTRLRVTDASGRTSTANVVVNVNINNLAPVADPGGPYFTGRVGAGFAAVRLDGRASFDPNRPCDAVVRYEWDVDRNGTADLIGAQVNYTNPAWQVGMVQIVRLTVCDTFNVCSAPVDAEIRVQLEAPPVGEILSPRADFGMCVPAGDLAIQFSVNDPEGEPVTVIALIGGVEYGRTVVQTVAGGPPTAGQIVVAAGNVPDGARDIVLRFEDNAGAFSTATAGGRIDFDHTPPVVTVGAAPVLNACYSPNNIPPTQYVATDNLDMALTIDEGVANNGCGRTVTVRAMDNCGNTGQDSRSYRVAELVQVDIQGANEGQLVANPRITWSVVGPADCAGQITATLARNGGGPAPYVANTEIVQPGNYALTLSIPNCQGVARQEVRNFVVNGPPTAVPVPAAHANRDPAVAGVGGYLVAEGGALTVDGRESLPPEAIDSIALYEWDFTGDGAFDARGATVAYPTQDNGIFHPVLRATDSLGATHSQAFQVTVTDVNPIADPGGPYTVAQGSDLTVDASRSRPGSPADTIRTYAWNWGDGTASAPSPNPQAIHAWAADGVYSVRLTVTDEDSATTADVLVTVTDVSPEIVGIRPPADPYEIADMSFGLDVNPGTAGEPITRIEWDFDGDAVADPGLVNQNPAITTFRDAGRRAVTVRVYDRDSVSVRSLDFDVREITLGELSTVAGVRAAAVIADPAQPAIAKARLQGYDTWAANGAWGQRHDPNDTNYKGNTWVAVDQLTFIIARSQAVGGRFGNLLWAISRQVNRDITRKRRDIVDIQHRAGANDQAIIQADAYIQLVVNEYNRAGFEADVTGAQRPIIARDLFANAYDAYFFLRRSIDPWNRYNGFPSLSEILDPQTRVIQANAVNDDLNVALAELHAQLQAYVDEGVARNDTGPGRPAVTSAMRSLDEVMRLTAKPIALQCPDGSCINDQEALYNELALMDLISSLFDAQADGVYVRDWQHLLMTAVKFRIEVSLLRVEFACGQFSPTSTRARAVQAAGLAMVDAYQYDEALQYYIDPVQRCLILETYNTCLVRVNRGLFPAEVYPPECQNQVAGP